LLGSGSVGVGGVPLRAAHGGQEDRVGALAGRERLVGQRDAVRVDRGPAEDVLLVVELGPERAQDLECRREHLRADPVAGEGDDGGHGAGGYGL
jgi:hypothetical protein